MRRLLYAAAFALLGAALVGSTTGCVPTGFYGDDQLSYALKEDKTPTRLALMSNAGYSLTPGTNTFYTGIGAPWAGGVKPNAGGEGYSVPKIMSYQLTKKYTQDHGGWDPLTVAGIGIASPPSSDGLRKAPEFINLLDGITAETLDTNGDGTVSGAIGICGLTSAVAVGIWAQPPGIWRDVTTCTHNLAPYTSAVTGGTGIYGLVLEKDSIRKGEFNPYEAFTQWGNNALTDRLPMRTVASLLNSVDTENDVRVENGVEILRLHLTGMNLWGQTYTPQNVSFDVQKMSLFTLDPYSPGLRDLAGWMSTQVAEAVARGESQWQGSFTFNGSAVVGTELMSAMKDVRFHGPSQGLADMLAEFAAGTILPARAPQAGFAAAGGSSRSR